MRRTVITAVLAAGLLLTACTGGSEKAAEPSASSDAATTPAVEESATSDDDAAKEAEEDVDKTLDELERAPGETTGAQDGTYEITKSQPDYEDPSLALDDEYIAPGTYTTKGPAGQSSDCSWARMRDASGQAASVIADDLSSGRATVTLEEGEFFKTSGCKPWTRSGD
jgi:hypothetical protein